MHPLDDPAMRDSQGRPLEWLNCILRTRDFIEPIIRGVHGDQRAMWGNKPMVGYTTKRLLGDDPVIRAHRWLVEHLAPARVWSDPVC